MSEQEIRAIKVAVMNLCRAPEFVRVRRFVQATANTGGNPAPVIEAIVAELGRILGETAVVDPKPETSFVRG